MTVWVILACSATSRSPGVSAPTGEAAVATLLQGGIVVGQGTADLRFRGGRIVEIGPDLELGDDEPIDVRGRFLVPAFIDSHVHLAYRAEGEAMADGGVAGVVDLASPMDFLALDHAPLRVLASGPMVTAEGGYPTRSWGSGGYGVECADAGEAVAAVDRLHAAGAGVIKLPVTESPQLDDVALLAVVDRAHALGLRVASHALEDDAVVRAAAAGVDALAHTPVAVLEPGSAVAWSGRAVVSTLSAFGGSAAALTNLGALRDAGAAVLYGTDFGNTRTAGIDPEEVALLRAAGLSGAEILAAGTSAPAAFWGFPDLGVIQVGRAASVLVLTHDPTLLPDALATPEQVWISGVRRP